MENENKKPAKKQAIGAVLMLLLFFALGIALGILLIAQMPEDIEADVRLMSWLAIFLGIWLGTYVHVIVHEAGHLVFGLLTGYRFVSFRILSLTLCRTENGFKWARVILPGTAGQCLMMPPVPKDGKKLPVVLYNLGGVGFTLLFSAGAIALGCVLPLPFSMLFFTVGLFGILLFFTNSIPLKGIVSNDGSNLAMLLRNDRARTSFANQLAMNARLTCGERLCEMPDEWFERPDAESEKNIMLAAPWVFRCNRLMRPETLAQAEAELRELLNGDAAIIDIHKQLLTLDLIFCVLVNGNDPDGTLAKWNDPTLRSLRKKMKSISDILRTEYAYARLYEKDTAKADRLLVQLEKAWRVSPFQGEVQNERALIELVKSMEI